MTLDDQEDLAMELVNYLEDNSPTLGYEEWEIQEDLTIALVTSQGDIVEVLDARTKNITWNYENGQQVDAFEQRVEPIRNIREAYGD